MGSVKNFSKRVSIYKIAFAAIFLFLFSPICFSQELPQNGTVVGGDTQAQLDYSQPNTLNVNVHADKVITDWKSFNVGSGNTVNFNRDSSFIALNRVTGADPSSIFGNINAPNGQIFLVNPNGIIFGSGSHVNAAGLIASTLDITNENFMNGNYEFFKVAGKDGYIVNKGIISTSKPGGYICLFSQAIDNQGVAIADLGTVVLAAGEEITMSLDDRGTISVVIAKEVQSAIFDADGNRMNSAIKNSGRLQANGGKIILTAEVLNGVFDYAINNSGVIQAAALNEHDGVVELTASGAPIINTATGTIEASGSITINSNSDIINDGTIEVEDTTPTTITGPVIIIDAGGGTITNTGSIMANGTAVAVNGGRIALIAATVLQNGIIIANAYDGGSAGKVEIIAQNSVVFGHNSTTAAACPFNIGNGGQIIVSSTNGSVSVLDGAVIDVSAGTNQGNAGSVDIDAFDQIGFYGVLNGRAPPGYTSAQVKLRTTRLFNVSLLDTYSLYLSGNITAEKISILTGQKANITGTLTANDIIYLDCNGADLIGNFYARAGIFNMNLGDTNLSGLKPAGTYSDAGNIFVVGDLTFSGIASIIADSDNSGGGSFTQNAGTTIDAGGFDLTIRSGSTRTTGSSGTVTTRDITNVNNLEISSGGSGAVSLSGPISTNGTLEVYSKNADITVSGTLSSALAMTLYADSNNNGSGNLIINSAISTTNQDITLRAADFTIANTVDSGSGNIKILNSDNGLTFAIGYTSGSQDIKLSDAEIGYLNSTGTIIIGRTDAGNITVNTADFGTKNVSLISGGWIRRNGTGTALTAAALTLNADSIGSSGTRFTTSVTNLSATANSGSIYITESNGLNLTSATATGSDSDIDVLVSNGNLNVGTLTATGDNITLVASSGSILDNGSNISCDNLIMTASSGASSIGTQAAPINTTVSDLALTSGTGGIYVTEADGADISALASNGGDVIISNDNGLLRTTSAINTSGGSLTLESADDLRIGNSNTDDIDSGAGVITLTADSDEDGTGTLSFNSGITLTSSTTHNLQGDNNFNINAAFMARLIGGATYLSVKSTAGNITVNNDISKSAGIDLRAAGNIIVNNDLTASGGSADIILYADNDNSGAGNFSQAAGTSINAGNDVTINAGGDISLGVINAGNNVYLISGGAILDTNGPSNNISAISLLLSAVNGIGSLDVLETQVSNLAALNTTSGDINIENTSDLIITTIDLVVGVTNLGGSIGINTLGSLTVNSDVTALNNIALSAQNSATLGNLTVNANVTSSAGGTIDLVAENDYVQNLTSAVSTSGTVNIGALNVTMNDSSSINAFYVDIDADNNLVMYDDSSISSGGDADIYVGGNMLMDNSSDISVDGTLNLTVDGSLTMSETDGDAAIYAGDEAYLTIGNNLDMHNDSKIDVASYAEISADAISMYDQSSIEANDIYINASYLYMFNSSLITSVTDIEMDITNDLVMNEASSIIAGNNIDISAGNNIHVAYMQAGNTVTLDAGGAVIDSATDTTAFDIVGIDLILSASNGIGSGDALETEVSYLNAYNSTSGGINIINEGDLNATSVINDALDGDITLTVNSNLTIGIITALNSVNLNANTGSILDGNGAANNITCQDLNLYAADDIGTNADYIDTTVGSLTITGADNAYINEFDSILLNNINVNSLSLITKNLGTVTSAVGTKITATDLDINADGAININTNVDTINLVTSNDNINVNEDNNLALNLVNAGTGDVTLNSTGAITDANGGLNNITANNLNLAAITTIASLADALDINITGDLTLTIAGSQGSSTGSVGTMGVSGNFSGTVGGTFTFVPGTQTNPPFVGNPPGYIFFNNIEIWPNIIASITGLTRGQLNQLNNRSRISAYYEIIGHSRVTSADTATPFFYGYHPLTPTDFSAFDGINLDIGAYDFIEDSLKFKNPPFTFYQ